jgi:hypothetical protein
MGSAGVLIFVFAGVSCGLARAILAEFAAVPNDPSAEAPAAAAETSTDMKLGSDIPTPTPANPPRTEIGGPKGPEPTRFGDWERNGRCVDF